MITAARPTSEPVPAVVGIATTGAIPSVLARSQLSPTSSKSHSGPGLAGHEGDRLGGIEAAAAAERDHAVVAARPQRLDAALDVGAGRVRPDLCEQAAGEPGVGRDSEHAVTEGVLGKSGVGDQQRARHAERPAGLRQLHDPPRPEPDPGRIAPVAAQGLGVDGGHDAAGSGW